MIGRVKKRPIGTFQYEKRLSPETSVVCQVVVFLLNVDKQLNKWPEMACRQRRWFPPAEAASRVTEGELCRLLLRLDELCERAPMMEDLRTFTTPDLRTAVAEWKRSPLQRQGHQPAAGAL